MSARYELNDMELDMVIGGAFGDALARAIDTHKDASVYKMRETTIDPSTVQTESVSEKIPEAYEKTVTTEKLTHNTYWKSIRQ